MQPRVHVSARAPVRHVCAYTLCIHFPAHPCACLCVASSLPVLQSEHGSVPVCARKHVLVFVTPPLQVGSGNGLALR
eukprot:15458379-Alexandrium_andersonii.AAC.1